MKSIMQLRTLALLAFCAWGQIRAQDINAYSYWIDDDVSAAVTIPVTPAPIYTLTTPIPTSALDPGFHKISIMFRDANSKWSVITERYFSKSGKNMTAYHYWFDDDLSTLTNATATSFATLDLSTSLPTTTLGPGIHKVSMQFKNGDNSWSEVTERYFSKTGADMTAWQYWFDDNVGALVETPIGPSTTVNVMANVDASAFISGSHNITWRSKDALGSWSVPVSQDFDVYTGIAEIPGLESALLMPNPADDHIQMRLEASSAELSYAVLDACGRMMSGKEWLAFAGMTLRSIDVSNFAPGVYQLRLIGRNGVKCMPFIKR
ncbi:MAG: T9SS type A sorting domain-containing protein [Flavobacteriales bacterium]